jgi:exopolysaccharide biosynthesis polyprenyl glycosylphosphotransferase
MSATDGILWSTEADAECAPPRRRFQRRGEPMPRGLRELDALTAVAGDLAGAVDENRRRDRRYRRSLAAGDVLAGWLTILAVEAVVGSLALLAGLVVVPLALITFGKLLGLYDRDEAVLRKTTLDEAPNLFQSAGMITVGLWLAGILPSDRLEFALLLATLFCSTLAARTVARWVVARHTAVERCVFVGERREYQHLAAKLDSCATGAQLVACISPQTMLDYGDTAPGAGSTHILSLLGHSGAQRVIIEPTALPSRDTLELVRAIKGLGLRVSLLPKVLDVVGTAVEFDELDGVTLLGVRSFGMSRSSWIAKRTFDVLVAGLALIVTGPLMALIALAIKLDSGGPVLFRQIRIGRNGHPFEILKFRTMVRDAEQRKDELRKLYELPEDGLFKLLGDPRMTRVGRILRPLCLDELPQLLNVLRGEMSVVGPRPLVVDEDTKILGWDRRRLHLTPGITGRWQIAGSERVPLPEMVKIDYLYAARWSLWLDMKILLRTVPFMLRRGGM